MARAAADREVYTVTIEPAGIAMEVFEDETVLDAAFRQGIALMHGCKEGQCGSCKAIVVEGDPIEDVELLKFSSFALPDAERDTGHVLLCRTQLFADISIELLNVDEELLLNSAPVASHKATVLGVESLTHDIRRLSIEIDRPMEFRAGQYVDITLAGDDAGPGVTRAFSMANPPQAVNPGGESAVDDRRLEFIIKKYPDGCFSARLDGDATESGGETGGTGNGLKPGDTLDIKGPYGSCFRRTSRTGTLLLVGGGSGMSPLLSILHDQLAVDPSRRIRFFYGARTVRDLFHLEEFADLVAKHSGFEFVPALSEPDMDGDWSGETGFVHEVLKQHLGEEPVTVDSDAYACGPPPMIDALVPVLEMNGIEPDHLHIDKFTPATTAA